MQYGRKCLVCKNTRHRERGLRLFRFPPRDSPLWQRWLQACGLSEADIDPNSREPPRLCHRHFQQKDFLTRQLTGMAVPSLFPVEVFTEAVQGAVASPNVGFEEEKEQEELQERDQQEEEQQQQQQVIEEVVYHADVQPDQLIEFNGSIEDFLDDVVDSVDVTPAEEIDFVHSLEQTVDGPGEELTFSEKVCNDENHAKLLEELEHLRQELVEKDKVINQQQELLAQLGVHFVSYND